MQFSMNTGWLVGRAGKDSELKTIGEGTSICEFSMATKRSFKKKGDNNWTNIDTWHNIKGFGDIANKMTMVKKGDNVVVHGFTEQRSWDGSDGQKKYKTEVTIDFFGVLKDYPSSNNEQNQTQDQNQAEGW